MAEECLKFGDRDLMDRAVLYTRSGKTSPSSNYRILQYADKMDGGVEARPMSPEVLYKHHANAKTRFQKAIWYPLYYLSIQWNVTRFMIGDMFRKPDCIVVQRALSPKFIFPWNKWLMEQALRKCRNLIWDFDDEIFNSKEITAFEASLLEQCSRKIVVTSEFLKDRLRKEFQSKVEFMPTTDGDFVNDSLDDMLDQRRMTYEEQIELLWLATSPSLPHLHKIREELDSVAEILKRETGKKLILHVICNKPLEFKPMHLVLDNTLWSRDVAREMIHRSHIGIMPLTNTISSKGKGGFKIVQYMSAGMPAVVSAIGYNNEIVVDGKTGFLVDDVKDTKGWQEAILKLAVDWNIYKEFCFKSRSEWNSRFSYNKNLERWKCLIRGV